MTGSRRGLTMKESDIPREPKPESERIQALKRLRIFLKNKGYTDFTVPTESGQLGGDRYRFGVNIKFNGKWDGKHRIFEVWPITTKRPKGWINQVSGPPI